MSEVNKTTVEKIKGYINYLQVNAETVYADNTYKQDLDKLYNKLTIDNAGDILEECNKIGSDMNAILIKYGHKKRKIVDNRLTINDLKNHLEKLIMDGHGSSYAFVNEYYITSNIPQYNEEDNTVYFGEIHIQDILELEDSL
jgi:hypothetical protein